MTREEIQAKLIELAAHQAGVPAEQVTPASHFVNDLNYDSLDTVEYAMAVEDAFHVTVPDEKIEQLQRVGDVIDLVTEQVNAPAA
jgi:acyl carrier protein